MPFKPAGSLGRSILALASAFTLLMNASGCTNGKTQAAASPERGGRSTTMPSGAVAFHMLPFAKRANPRQDTGAQLTYVAALDSGTKPAEFSGGTVTLTPKGQRPMLGWYNEDGGVTFKLDNLPPHEVVHLVFDLAVLNSWNGSSTVWGPDVWSCDEITTGRKLFAATFCNNGFWSNNNEQSFPDIFPSPAGAKPHAGWTGAAEQQTLGVRRVFDNDEEAALLIKDCSSVYHMDWTFTHDLPCLELKFSGKFKAKNKWFGFLNFRAETVANVSQLSAEEMVAAWADLGGDDPVKASAAVWKLAGAGNAAVAFVDKSQRRPATQPTTSPTASPYLPGRIDHLLQLADTPASRALRIRLNQQAR